MLGLSPRARWAVPALVVLGALLQATRLPFRWNQITFAYAAYFREYVRIVDLEGPLAALTTFVGAHPPGYSMLFAGLMAAAAPPLAWMALSGAFSVSAVFSSAAAWGPEERAAGVATAAVLAVSPYRNAYGLEINDYPMLVGVAALQWWAFARWVRGGGAAPLVAATAAVVWTHALGITLPLAQGLALTALRGRAGLRVGAPFAAAAVLCVPLLVGVLANREAPPINDPPGWAGALDALVHGLPGRYGVEAATWALVGVATVGAAAALRRAREHELAVAAAAQVLIGGGVIAWMVRTGAAADHQFPYYLVLLPASALLIGAACARSRVAAGVTGVALLLHLGGLVGDAREARRVYAGADATHGLVARAVEAWGPGDSLLLVQFPVHGDDDKDYVDAAYAHLPWTRRVHFDDPEVPTQVPADPYFGQPVRMGDRWLYTFATFDPEKFDLILQTATGRGERVVVVQYDTQQQPQDGERLAFWGSSKGRRPERDDNEALWVFLP